MVAYGWDQKKHKSFKVRKWPASDDNIKVLKPIKSGTTSIRGFKPTKEVHNNVCIVPQAADT